MTANRLGVLAFGDSITNGGGELQWGVALQSWALWVARATGLPFTSYAVDGARIRDLIEQQIPAWRRTTAHPDEGYELGCLYIGVNDVRALDWDPGEFERDYVQAIAFLTERCDRTLTVTAPLDLGRPPAGTKVEQLNAIVERTARKYGTLILDLSHFNGRELVMADHVHPTAFGQIAIAKRAIAVLAGDGVPVRADPEAMILYEITPYKRLRSELTYAYRRAKVSGRQLLFKAGWLRL